MPLSTLQEMGVEAVLEHVNVPSYLSTETVRNHIRRVLRATGAHSRLGAVAIANGAY